MLKWLLTLFVITVLWSILRAHAWPRAGRARLPGDIVLRWRGRRYFLPFTSTVILSVLAGLLSRLI